MCVCLCVCLCVPVSVPVCVYLNSFFVACVCLCEVLVFLVSCESVCVCSCSCFNLMCEHVWTRFMLSVGREKMVGCSRVRVIVGVVDCLVWDSSFCHCVE